MASGMAFYLRRTFTALCRSTENYFHANPFIRRIKTHQFHASYSSITHKFIHTDYSHSVHTSRKSSSKASVIDVEGPIAAADYSSILPEEEFHKLADNILHGLQERLEEYEDQIEIDGFDMDYASGVLTLKLGTLGTYVINKQTPNRQIWLSSPVSGPARFDWDRENQAWIYRRTKANLVTTLERELSGLLNTTITLAS